ncbi:MAG: FAD-dependent thymidylate synthase [Oscillospiraceae bacterium]|nr:FAD-dependent thymidylate synthase [Oscillospiraceae bacterium]
MKIIPASYEILAPLDPAAMLRNLESCARVCYKSEAAAAPGSAGPFLRKLIRSGHESVIEHEKITVRLICDRGVSHEIVRHRIASYSQESTRYCNYGSGKFGGELTFIRPCFWPEEGEAFAVWREQMAAAEAAYLRLTALGIPPEQARSILPNSLKTELMMTMNLREWRHFFRLRASRRAHPQARELAVPLLAEFRALLPDIFEELEIDA